eukprot:TRINITY_DN3784_c0_g1_i2.p1 TRINITY_DN3784_c0_g1~~TRINITY_DN3784_c0_g1_i2.p1  ORF type:complete len:366 (-),score=95.59 TRINITY_DN3784_c0_g1_i2:168-1265(-)
MQSSLINETDKRKTIIVKHLPDILTSADLNELFGHYGATEVRRFDTGKLRNVVFVDFESNQSAQKAVMRFNFLRLFGNILSAEFAANDKKTADDFRKPKCADEDDSKKEEEEEEEEEEESELFYRYPSPTASILANICSHLASVPTFYTQVLHLMNKMNLPPPFATSISSLPFPLKESMVTPEEESNKRKRRRRRRRDELLSSSESELDSDAEASPATKRKNTNDNLSSFMDSIANIIRDNEIPAKQRESCISMESLLAGKTPQYEWMSLFPNYEPGVPSVKLYIKNISKTVTEVDLRFIFSRFYPTDEAAQSEMTITLFQSGKMKGQAFVTYSTKEQAIRALNEVHAYRLHGQPLIIQFAREKN